ncbi:MAG: hypothetical protein K1X42_15080 [Opitutaceae bacterium]|nr:hypothetical protein [Opitutaceae bacterium]
MKKERDIRLTIGPEGSILWVETLRIRAAAFINGKILRHSGKCDCMLAESGNVS